MNNLTELVKKVKDSVLDLLNDRRSLKDQLAVRDQQIISLKEELAKTILEQPPHDTAHVDALNAEIRDLKERLHAATEDDDSTYAELRGLLNDLGGSAGESEPEVPPSEPSESSEPSKPSESSEPSESKSEG